MIDEDKELPEKSYSSQKREVLELLTEYVARGNAFIDDLNHSEDDREEVETGLSILRESTIGFYAFLEQCLATGRIIDPAVLNVAQFFRAAVGGASMAFAHLEKSEVAASIIYEEIAKVARAAKATTDEERMELHREVLREFIGYRPVTMPYKEAETIFYSEEEKRRLQALCEARGIEMFSKSTAIRRFQEMKVQL